MIDARLQRAAARYDPITVRLHWITVGLVAVLWGLGQIGDELPRSLRGAAWSVHVVLGFTLALVLLTRIVWRSRFGQVLPAANAGVLGALATTTHYALYALLIAAVATGLANASYRGISVFGVWSVPQFGTGDRAMRRAINGWHELAANTILVVALCHAAAALFHHYVRRDGLLERMRVR